MARAALFACYGALLMGCQSVPLLDGEYLPGRPPPAPHALLLFEETEATNEAVKQVVLRHVPPGTPIKEA